MLAIIPARGGSKGVIGKNIKVLSGKPLIAHTIIAAIDSKSVDRIIVSTDSEEIAEVAVKYGAEVPFLRPYDISHDTAAILDAYKFVLKKLKESGDNYDSFVALQPTSPFRNSHDINSAISLFNNQETDSIISFTGESHPIEWSRLINNNGTFSDLGMDLIYNRQKYKKTYYFNGAVYVFKTKLLKKNIIYSDNSLAYIMPRIRSIDIDTEEDFLFAEFLIQNLKK